MGNKHTSRREFLKKASIAGAGFTIVPRYVLGGTGYTPPSDKLQVAVVGAGGRGASLVREMWQSSKERIQFVAFADVDSKRAAGSYKAFPKAKQYQDYRIMLAEMEKKIDAVVIATPDHSHAGPALMAMNMGKHVYVEKPLAHTIEEARMLTEKAAEKKLTTQMGNFGASGEGVRQMMEWFQAGLIGEVKRVHAWTNRPIWPQGVSTPTEKMDIPNYFNWDLWLGPAPKREYNPAFTHFKWRGWWDYGTGALGDMGCHIIDAPFQALKLGYPISAEASVAQNWVGDFVEADFQESCPSSSKVHIQFPEREGMPPVELIWYDGGMKPTRPEELPEDMLFGSWDGGVLFEGSKAKMMCNVYGLNPIILNEEIMAEAKKMEPSIPRITEGHYANWVNGCLDGTPTSSGFSFAGPLSETVLMGNLAIRSHETKVLKPGRKVGDWAPYNYPGRTKLMWDGQAMKVTNLELANAFVTKEYRKGWELKA